ncbi:multidrug efflux SMR transporter [Paenibacillus anaericanus]|uniref:Multidrug efflux SMR transporter n=1 Tax=Paenibacillus anaericanus TaxID=170367 RepID=A0A3S1BFD4_9BACL|nr:multidrug efflux SMR transporter [Paenibacillus anaericanus]RUT40323.1 multidrug efflux SMR transporter [Paenibacillus anaericanus]
MKKGYILLALAIIFETFGATMLKLSEGFTNLFPTLGLIVGMGGAFYFLALCLRMLPLSFAYAVWAGTGTAITALIGVILWDEPYSFLTGIGLILIIGGVVLLNISKEPDNSATPAEI